MPQLYTYARFFRPYFSCPFCGFSILVFLTFSFIFSTPSWKWRSTLFVLEVRHLFLWSSGHSVQKKLPNCWRNLKDERWSSEWSKVKEWMAVFFTNCVITISEKAVSICVIIPKNRKVKKFQLHIINQSFEHNDMDISYQKRLESLDLKKAVHTSCKHVSEGFVNFIPKEDRPANSRDLNPLETIWIIVDETTYKDPAPKTLDELRQWLRFAWKNVTLDTLWELVHAIPHRLENIRKHTRRYSGF